MGKRGPKSQSLAAVPEVGKRQAERPSPLPGMSTRSRAMWRRIVASLPAEHFRDGDLPLLRDYCEAYDRSVQAEAEIRKHGLLVPAGSGLLIGKGKDGESKVEALTLKANPACAIKTAAAHTMKALAVALRLCVNSRMTPKQANKEEKPAATPSKRKMFGG